MIGYRFLFLFLVLSTLVGRGSAQIFIESFDGGFDHAGWGLGGYEDTFEFTDSGLHFDVAGSRTLDSQAVVINRIIDLEDSFHLSLRVRDLELIAVPSLDTGRSGVTVALAMRDPPPNGLMNGLIFGLTKTDSMPDVFRFGTNTSGNLHTVFVEPGESSAIDVLLRDGTATYYYDRDSTDTLSGEELFSSEYRGVISDRALLEIRAYGVGFGGGAVGVFDHLVVTPISDIPGDFSGTNGLDVADVDLLIEAIQIGDASFDLTGDQLVDFADLEFWIHELKQTYFGDTNLDGEFASSDLVLVFRAGEYEDDVVGNSRWGTGDWNGDGDFTSSDLVMAFQDGGYEQGPRSVASTVPEPSGSALLLVLLPWLLARGRKQSVRIRTASTGLP